MQQEYLWWILYCDVIPVIEKLVEDVAADSGSVTDESDICWIHLLSHTMPFPITTLPLAITLPIAKNVGIHENLHS